MRILIILFCLLFFIDSYAQPGRRVRGRDFTTSAKDTIEAVSQKNGGYIAAEWYGVDGSDSDDDTEAFQNAIDAAYTLGKNVILPSGTIYISIANSINAQSCIIMRDGVSIKGQGITATTIQRLVSERAVEGVFMVTDGWDTAEDYGAAGNFVLEDFTITEGDPDSLKDFYGDLIAIAHSKNVIVRNVRGLNHDQHLVDVSGSRDITIMNCVDSNLVVNPFGCATFQIEDTGLSGVLGINTDTTNSQNIRIINNTIYNKNSQVVVQLHNTGLCVDKDILIEGNTIVAPNGQAIGKDTDAQIENLIIRNNFITCNDTLDAAISLICADGDSIKNVLIDGNTINGTFRYGIALGSLTGVTSETFLNYENVRIVNNNIKMDFDFDIAEYGIWASFLKDVIISNNTVLMTPGTTTGGAGIYINMCELSNVSNNIVKLTADNDSTSENYYGIRTECYYASYGLDVKTLITDNLVYGNGFQSGIAIGAQGGNPVVPHDSVWTGLVSGNFVSGTPVKGHYLENYIPMMDGTNNVFFQDWSGYGCDTDSTYLAATDSFYTDNIPLSPYWKVGSAAEASGISTQWRWYSSYAGRSGEGEIMTGFVTPTTTTTSGTQIVNVTATATAFTFALTTGSEGVHTTISGANWQPVYRTTGSLRLKVGL